MNLESDLRQARIDIASLQSRTTVMERIMKATPGLLEVMGDLTVEGVLTATISNVVPAARVSHDADQTISNNTQTTLAFNTEKYDYDAIHDNTTNNSRLTCKTAGLYTITASIQFASNSSGSRAILILLNGTTIIGGDQRDASPDIATTCNVSVDYPLAVNNYVEVQVYQNRGGNLNVVSSGERTPLFMMKYIGKAS